MMIIATMIITMTFIEEAVEDITIDQLAKMQLLVSIYILININNNIILTQEKNHG